MPLLSAVEYVYPVAILNNGTAILYIHQYSVTHIELFEWNLRTDHKEQILWSAFNPAGLQLLPDNTGFSFIDNGRLRVKSFQKRSPKAIDFDEPIFAINALRWIDEHSCYCSAKSNDNFSLFELHDEGSLKCLVKENDKDCLYPQKVDSQLFYIERCVTHDYPNALYYHVMQCDYPDCDLNSEPATLIVDFFDTPIAFLTMFSPQEGFVLEHGKIIDNQDPTTLFLYHHIIKEGDTWYKNCLFSFNVPTNLLLDGEQRLYESLLPLLPRIIDNKIYFVDCIKDNNLILEPYFYDLLTKMSTKIIMPAKKEGHCFVPMLCNSTLYCGGTFPFVLF
jgi:hypothetical protein